MVAYKSVLITDRKAYVICGQGHGVGHQFCVHSFASLGLFILSCIFTFIMNTLLVRIAIKPPRIENYDPLKQMVFCN